MMQLVVRASDISRRRKAPKFTKTRKIPRNSVEIVSNTYVCTTYLKLFSAIGAIYFPVNV